MNFEGNAYSQLLSLMKEKGYNKDVDVMIGVVKAAPPEVLIEIERSGIGLDKEDCIFAEKIANTLVAEDRVIIIKDRNTYFIIDKAVVFYEPNS